MTGFRGDARDDAHVRVHVHGRGRGRDVNGRDGCAGSVGRLFQSSRYSKGRNLNAQSPYICI